MTGLVHIFAGDWTRAAAAGWTCHRFRPATPAPPDPIIEGRGGRIIGRAGAYIYILTRTSPCATPSPPPSAPGPSPSHGPNRGPFPA